ncbi:hypothetical protein N2152v2_004253 [Parachlorella kessleri]
MLKEANDFAVRVKKVDKDLKGLGKAAELALDTSKVFLGGSLPRVYGDSTSAAVTPNSGGAGPAPLLLVGGPAFSGDQLAKAKTDLSERVQTDALGPIASWLARHADCAEKQKALNKAYEEMESWRKKVEATKAKAEGLRAKQGDPKAVSQLEEASKQQAVQEGKLQIATERHEQEEAAQFARLSALNRDAVSLRSHVRAALGSFGGGFAAALEAVPVVEVTEPGLPSTPVVGGTAVVPAPGLPIGQPQAGGLPAPGQQVAAPPSDLPVKAESSNGYPQYPSQYPPMYQQPAEQAQPQPVGVPAPAPLSAVPGPVPGASPHVGAAPAGQLQPAPAPGPAPMPAAQATAPAPVQPAASAPPMALEPPSAK